MPDARFSHTRLSSVGVDTGEKRCYGTSALQAAGRLR
jgi:hypothetical protein